MILSPKQVEIVISHLLSKVGGISAIYLFGSGAEDQYTDQSDIDLAVLSEDQISITGLWDIGEELASVLKRDVDLVDLLKTDTVHQMQIVSVGRRIYNNDDIKAEYFEDRVWQDYLTLNDDRREILDAIEREGTVYG